MIPISNIRCELSTVEFVLQNGGQSGSQFELRKGERFLKLLRKRIATVAVAILIAATSYYKNMKEWNSYYSHP